jgi:hypothetical protein
MSAPTQGPPAQWSGQPAEGWQGHYQPAGWIPNSHTGTGGLVTALAVIGLGALAWYYLGPDLRRYLKIRSM